MKKYRNEWKYCCTDLELKLLESRLNRILPLDLHTGESGKYVVHSLYFDDFYDTCCRDNASGMENKYKWRIRYYDDVLNTMHLEYKEKLYGRGNKYSCKLSKKEFELILKGDISTVLWNTNEWLLKKFCFDIMTKDFKPKVIIDYERIAYVEEITNVRITLDTNISASFEIDKFIEGGYIKYPLQDKNYNILEVKFDEILPGYIHNVVSSYGFKQSSFSKYYLGRKKMEEVLR